MSAVPNRPDNWEAFVRAYGWRARATDLAHVLGQPEAGIARVRTSGACVRHPQPKPFAELFSLWHGRAPTDTDWPPPRWLGGKRTYEWQAPECALLAQLVGQVDAEQIAGMLSRRLQQITGDPDARRSVNAVQGRTNALGLQSSDVLGGLTVAQAGREIGSKPSIDQAIQCGKLPTRRVGRLHVIPYEAWDAWKATHLSPTEGYVKLATLRAALGIRSDKLSEFARMGYVPTAVCCNPFGAGASTQFGTWWIDPQVAQQLVADRRAGRPMPWHGKPLLDNLRHSYALWQARRHPASCETCARIWGEAGPPETFDDYVRRYPVLSRGAKRHLTRSHTSGLTIAEVAEASGCSVHDVKQAIANGVLAATRIGRTTYVSRTDATCWKARRTPDGEGGRSWISFAMAERLYGFSANALRAMIARGEIKHRIGTNGPMRGIDYVLRQQCRDLRESIGLTHDEAAACAGVSVETFQALLDGLHWRQDGLIPFVTVQAVIKRLKSHCGYTIAEAAAQLDVPAAWVEARRDDGTVRLTTAKWAPARPYLTEPMMNRLRAALAHPGSPVDTLDSRVWLTLGVAAHDTGVSTGTLVRWAQGGEVERKKVNKVWRYRIDSVRDRARRYWATVRFRRAQPPAWLGMSRTDDALPGDDLEFHANCAREQHLQQVSA